MWDQREEGEDGMWKDRDTAKYIQHLCFSSKVEIPLYYFTVQKLTRGGARR